MHFVEYTVQRKLTRTEHLWTEWLLNGVFSAEEATWWRRPYLMSSQYPEGGLSQIACSLQEAAASHYQVELVLRE